MYDEEIQKIFDKLEIFENLYEQIRFVDPLRKKVLIYKDKKINELNSNCYDIWQKNKICINCISMRAYNEKQTFVKIEYTPKKLYMITAMPVELSNRHIVIELFKDTTNSMLFGDDDSNSKLSMYSLIDSMNILILKDALTDVYNRRYINERLPVDIIGSVISDKNLSIIITDIDFFKTINDKYGHLAGDLILKEFSSILKECLKCEDDWIARYGGEEFLVCLHNSTLEKSVEVAELMRASIQDKKFIYDNNTIKITSSFGVCSVHSIDQPDISSLINCADKNLYIAKNKGRNRVQF
ncbi:putative signal transduction GGDEF domain-containing protein [Gottschalkia acidurici 9a]|uniref:Signal transduction GGDEF domain-containing protein n=1 Tax=Gottschalkia acidurici (strain ATCC 7906 / DSM 604 / BCRC 14475 / CIP 104303 / KCTC 5404 / NCIMB 10678 / 9a) TaxID=1128398 RepID=K0AXD2_GOTA9|nr:GGDEF domain-containing protein [Gottschalkia acidurici]AFS77106.1 putative signal transduction GGDEF domain-containing protein [Gottschalkia acidurici 9a]